MSYYSYFVSRTVGRVFIFFPNYFAFHDNRGEMKEAAKEPLTLESRFEGKEGDTVLSPLCRRRVTKYISAKRIAVRMGQITYR